MSALAIACRDNPQLPRRGLPLIAQAVQLSLFDVRIRQLIDDAVIAQAIEQILQIIQVVPGGLDERLVGILGQLAEQRGQCVIVGHCQRCRPVVSDGEGFRFLVAQVSHVTGENPPLTLANLDLSARHSRAGLIALTLQLLKCLQGVVARHDNVFTPDGDGAVVTESADGSGNRIHVAAVVVFRPGIELRKWFVKQIGGVRVLHGQSCDDVK
jgi:hypothetical protein